jgi:hypothetical protein
LSNRPRDRPLIGHTNDEAMFTGEIGQDYFWRLRPPGP